MAIGVKNKTDATQTLVWDSKKITFAAGETRIVYDVPLKHIESRMKVGHKKTEDGKGITPVIVGVRTFQIVPLNEALKVARPDEDPEVLEARAKAEEKAKHEAEIAARVTEQVLANLAKEGRLLPQKKGKNAQEDE